MKETVRKCALCGTEFTTTTPRKIYCNEMCRRKVCSSNQTERRRNERKPKKKNKSLRELTVEARKHGMSYGQYVAMKGL